jgi:MFS family permease
VIVFILGFIGRALGSIVFGYIGDKISRKLSVILTALTLLIISVLLIVLYSYYTDFCKV